MKPIEINPRHMSDRSRQRRYVAGQRIVSHNNGSVKEMYIVISGRVNTFNITMQNTLAIAGTAGPGEAFAEAQMFLTMHKYVYRAVDDTVVYVVDEKTFPQLAAKNPQLVLELLRSAYAPGIQEANETEVMLNSISVSSPASIKKSPIPASTVSDGPAKPVMPKGRRLYDVKLRPEYFNYVYKKGYRCLNCGNEFEDYRIFASKLVQIGNTRYDLRKLYHNFKPELFEILTCPHCYFSAFSDYFIEKKSFGRDTILSRLTGAREELHLDFSYERDIDFIIAGHYLAIACAKGFANYRQLCMKLWGNLSWIYEDLGDVDMASYAARKSATAGENAYMETRLSKPQEQLVCLMVGGMLYRSGAVDGVMKWLFSAKNIRMGKKIYADLAEDLMETIRAQKEANR